MNFVDTGSQQGIIADDGGVDFGGNAFDSNRSGKIHEQVFFGKQPDG